MAQVGKDYTAKFSPFILENKTQTVNVAEQARNNEGAPKLTS